MKRKSVTQAMAPNAAGSAVSNPKSPNPSHEEIARLAYAYWEARGGQGGSPEQDWNRAEQEIQLFAVSRNGREIGSKVRETWEALGRGDPPSPMPRA